jgi:hypothetical protein
MSEMSIVSGARGPGDAPPSIPFAKRQLDRTMADVLRLDLYQRDLHLEIVQLLKIDSDFELNLVGHAIGRQAALTAYTRYRKRIDGADSRYISIYSTCFRQLLDEEFGTAYEQTWMFQIVREREQVNRDVDRAEIELEEATAVADAIDANAHEGNDEIARQLVPLSRLLTQALQDQTQQADLQDRIPEWIVHMQEITDLIQGGPRTAGALPQMILSLQAQLEQLSVHSTV